MGQVVTVIVTDGKHTQAGVKVHTYGGVAKYSDKNGKVVLALEGGDVTIYVNGFTAYSGAVSRLPEELLVDKQGRRLI